MTSKTKTTARMNKSKKPSGTTLADARFRFHGSEWLVLPLGVLTLICIYVFLSTLQNFNPSLTSPTVISLLVGVFSVLFVYRALRVVPRHPVATLIAYVFSVALAILTCVLIATSGNECGGDCSTSSALVAWLVVFNPYVAILWSPLAIVGIVSLLVKKTPQ